jgi:hypothetical protein
VRAAGVGEAKDEMPMLQDWSWQMRRRASADRRDRRGSRRVQSVGGTPGHEPTGFEAGVQAHISNLLKAMYDSALNEPVPERFLELLRQMDAQAAAGQADAAEAAQSEQPPGGVQPGAK